jgi:hypothetical protein
MEEALSGGQYKSDFLARAMPDSHDNVEQTHTSRRVFVGHWNHGTLAIFLWRKTRASAAELNGRLTELQK